PIGRQCRSNWRRATRGSSASWRDTRSTRPDQRGGRRSSSTVSRSDGVSGSERRLRTITPKDFDGEGEHWPTAATRLRLQGLSLPDGTHMSTDLIERLAGL